MVPSIQQYAILMKKYRVPEHIRDHSVVVAKIALIVARGLRGAGVDVSLETIMAGALMHDIAKALCLGSTDDHAARGREICIDNHLEEIADIVGEHVRLNRFEPEGDIHGKEIVYYADKRVNHDQVVSLEDRLNYLLGRYGKEREHVIRRIRENFELCRRVEKKLFAKLTFNPSDLGTLVRDHNVLFLKEHERW